MNYQDHLETSSTMTDQSCFMISPQSLGLLCDSTMLPHRSDDFEHDHLVATRPGHMQGCSLAEATLDQDTPFSEAEVACLMQQVLSGLQHLHSSGVSHGNLRLSNLIIDAASGNIKLLVDNMNASVKAGAGKASLGESRVGPDGCCTFRSPEQLSGTVPSKFADVWCIGGLTLELLIRGSPREQAQRLSRRPALQDAENGKPPQYPVGLSLDCISFLEECFAVDPADRASTAELFEHPFIVDGCAQHEAADVDSQLCSAIDSVLIISEQLRLVKPTCRPAVVTALPSKGKARFSAPSHTERECRFGNCGMCGLAGSSLVTRFTGLAPIVSAQKTVTKGVLMSEDGSAGARSPVSAASTKRGASVLWDDRVQLKMEKPTKRLCNQWFSEELAHGNDLSLLGFAT